MKPNEIDIQAALTKVLREYGASPTPDGWMAVTMELLVETGRLPKMAYNPDVSPEDHTIALLADAFAERDIRRKKRNQSDEARHAFDHLKAIGDTRYQSSSASLRQKLIKQINHIAELWESKRSVPNRWLKSRVRQRLESWKAYNRPRFAQAIPVAKPAPVNQVTALEALELWPEQAVGQMQLGRWWNRKLVTAANAMTRNRSGCYEFECRPEIAASVWLSAITIVEDEDDHAEGAPRRGAWLSPVRILVDRQVSISIPTEAGPVPHRWQGSDVVPPSRCMLSGDKWAWTGHLDDGTRLEIRGTVEVGDLPQTLTGEMVVTPPRNRSWRQSIRCVRQAPVGTGDL